MIETCSHCASGVPRINPFKPEAGWNPPEGGSHHLIGGFGDGANGYNAHYVPCINVGHKHDCLVAYLRTALFTIAQGRGRFSRDPMTHAENTIEDMKRIATAAARGEWEKPD